MSAWLFSALGGAALRGEDRILTLERRTAALLLYLALEGPTPRSKLAGLLWPESREKTARNNLRQLLKRLRAAAEQDLVLGGDLLRLAEGLEVDAAQLKVGVFLGEAERVAGFSGELLSYDYDDLSDFSDWLYAERERLAALKRDAYAAEAERLEELGDLREARLWAERLTDLEPLSEEGHRRLMRLHFLLGERAAALAAYERCRSLLKRDLGVEPLPETALLAQAIERGTRSPEARPSRRPLPLSVERPPVLAGREEAWERLERAWEAGQAVFLAGEPGIGKTRLMLDFATSKGPFALLEARPSDSGVPYATHARHLRRFLAEQPDKLEPWVRRELSRLVPELSSESPPPLGSEADKLRFFEAERAFLLGAARGLSALVTDDLHYYDSASFEMGSYLIPALRAEPGFGCRSLNSFRTGEVSPAVQSQIERLVEAGVAVLIELEPLSGEAVQMLLEGLELPAAEGLGEALSRYTGGNPLFIVETLKSLCEMGGLAQGFPARLPAPERVTSLLSRRLERLSSEATRLIQTLAVSGSDFSLELAGRVLRSEALELEQPWRELEAAQMVKGSWFSHDLLYESALRHTPLPVAALLHRRTAHALQALGAASARVAYHYLAAGALAEAAPLLHEAALAAKAAFQLGEAADFFAQAAELFEGQGERLRAFASTLGLLEVLAHFDSGEATKRALGKLQGLARTSAERAQVHSAWSDFWYRLGRAAEAERAARSGLAEADLSDEPALQIELLNALGTSLWLQNRMVEARGVLEEVVATTEELNDAARLSIALTNLGVVCTHLEAQQEALGHFAQAERLAAAAGERVAHVQILNNLGVTQSELGLVRAGLGTLEQAAQLLEGSAGSEGLKLFTLGLMGVCQRDLGRFREALTALTEASRLAKRYESYAAGVLDKNIASVLLLLGAFEEAERRLEEAFSWPNLTPFHQALCWLLRAELQAQQETPNRSALAQAEALAGQSRKLHAQALLVRASSGPAEGGLVQARDALGIACQHDLNGLRLAAETRCAQKLLELGQPENALEHTKAAQNLLERYQPTEFYHAEILWTHYRALAALGDEGAAAQLSACQDWVKTVAENHVPSEYRQSFLERNPVNRAVLEVNP